MTCILPYCLLLTWLYLHTFHAFQAANYLHIDIKSLLDLMTCAKFAGSRQQHDQRQEPGPEQIRKQFNAIKNDFTPEEEEAVRAENKWAEES